MAEPPGGAGAEERDGGEGRRRGVEKAPRVAEAQGERWAAEPQGAVGVTAGQALPAVVGVAAARRPGEGPPANARHNIRRIYFPLEMTCDNSDI